jgi:hypothetical protein
LAVVDALRSDADSEERIGPAAGIPIFGLDALSSAMSLALGRGSENYVFR